jgi:hypothetical protein
VLLKEEQVNIRNLISATVSKRQMQRFGNLESSGGMGVQSGASLSSKASQVSVDKGPDNKVDIQCPHQKVLFFMSVLN